MPVLMLQLARWAARESVAPRAKVSTMIIAAPQCGQTKVGWPQAAGAVGRRRFGRGGDDVQQFARLGEMLAASGIGEQPVVADAVEAAGQNVQQEAAHELVGARASWSCSASCPWRGSPSSGR